MKKNTKIDYEIKEKIKIIGIVTPEKDYKLSWLINNLLDIQLKRSDIEIANQLIKSNENKSISSFLIGYSYIDEVKYLKFFLFKNKNENNIILKNLKNFDYFFIVYGIFSDEYTVEVVNKIKNLKPIIASYLLDNLNKNDLKIINKLINSI